MLFLNVSKQDLENLNKILYLKNSQNEEIFT